MPFEAWHKLAFPSRLLVPFHSFPNVRDLPPGVRARMLCMEVRWGAGVNH
jgi:hypothetical protein